MPLDSLTYSPTPVALDADGEILMRAAGLIEKHGWCQFTELDEDGRMCLIGGVVKALGLDLSDDYTINERARDCMVRMGFGPGNEPKHWNNAPERTVEQVLSRLRAAAQGVGR